MLEKLRARNPVIPLVSYFIVGAAGLILPWTREWFVRAVPFTLILSAGMLYLYHGKFSIRTWSVSLLIFTAGWLLEVIGIATGALFGSIHYGDTLGVKVFHTPLLIGVNWLVFSYCSMVIAGRFVEPLYFRAIVAGSMMVVFDFALEPAAIRLGMWHWTGGAVPLQNYLTWFVFGTAINYVAGRFRLPDGANRAAAPLFFIQLLFFITLDAWIVLDRVWDW